jgi:hypothetical protein
VDRACRLEAMLRNLSRKRKNLRVEQSQVDNQFIRLMKDLQLALQNDQDLTVIVADAFIAAPKTTDGSQASTMDSQQSISSQTAGNDGSTLRTESQLVSSQNNAHSDVVKPNRLESTALAIDTPETRHRSCANSFACFAGDVFENDLDEQNSVSQSPSLAYSNSTPSVSTQAPELFPSASHPSPTALRAGAEAWRAQYGQDAFTGIDFRTGMSGHLGLVSSQTHPHEYLKKSYTGGSATYNMPKMSSHTGLTMQKPRLLTGILSSLTLPSFSTVSQTEESRDQQVQHTGSM